MTTFQRAVFLSDLNTIRDIVESADFDNSLLGDLRIGYGIEVPVTYFTAAQLEIFRRAEEWDNGRGWVLKSKNKAVEVWHYWKDVLHLDTRIDYHRYAQSPIMFCDDEESDEEILEMSYEDLETHGVRRIDAELYVACWRVEIEKVNQLFLSGANPEARILEEDCYALDHVAAEASMLDTVIFPYYKDRDKEIPLGCFQDLLGFGAFERMYNILHGRGMLDYDSV